MRIYNKDNKAEKKLGRTIRYKYKRFRVSMIFCAAFLLMIIAGCLYIIHEAGDELDGLFEQGIFMALLLMFGFNILPIIGFLVSYWAGISGGRDILLCRRNEQIILFDREMKIQYSPIYRKVEDGEFVEKTIPYDRIQEMVYDRKFQRLEITTDYTYKLWRSLQLGDQSSNTVSSHYENAEIKIYHCFENMQDLMNRLSMAAGKQIQMK